MLPTPAYRTRTCFLIAVFLLSFSSLALGQEQSQYDKGTPPQHAAGVSSLGVTAPPNSVPLILAMAL